MATVTRKQSKPKRPEVKYEYRQGPHPRLPADEYARIIEEIRRANGGIVTEESLVEAARSEDSPLHDSCDFEWDDAVAAEEQRRDHAARLLRCYFRVEQPPEVPEPVRYYALVNTEDRDGQRGFVPTARAMSDEAMRAKVIAQAEQMLRGVINRYRYIPGLWEHLRPAFERLIAE